MVLAVHVLMLMVVLMLVLMHAMQQAAIALARKLLYKGSLSQGPARAQCELRVARAKVQVG